MTVEGFVAAGLPQTALAATQRDIVIRPLEVEGDVLTPEIGVVMTAGVYRPPAVAATVAILQEACGKLNSGADMRLTNWG